MNNNTIELNNSLSNISERLNSLEDRISENFTNENSFYNYEVNGNQYFVIVDGRKLNIPFYDTEKMMETIRIIDTALNTNNMLELTGDLHGRYIVEQLPFFENMRKIFSLDISDGINNTLIRSTAQRVDKNNIEELFIFIMDLKGIDSSNWMIGGQICRGRRVDCIPRLGNH